MRTSHHAADAYRYERRVCGTCGARFRAWYRRGEALATCILCCPSCEDSGDCSACGD